MGRRVSVIDSRVPPITLVALPGTDALLPSSRKRLGPPNQCRRKSAREGACPCLETGLMILASKINRAFEFLQFAHEELKPPNRRH
jgi:hypothetical protein